MLDLIVMMSDTAKHAAWQRTAATGGKTGGFATVWLMFAQKSLTEDFSMKIFSDANSSHFSPITPITLTKQTTDQDNGC